MEPAPLSHKAMGDPKMDFSFHFSFPFNQPEAPPIDSTYHQKAHPYNQTGRAFFGGNPIFDGFRRALKGKNSILGSSTQKNTHTTETSGARDPNTARKSVLFGSAGGSSTWVGGWVMERETTKPYPKKTLYLGSWPEEKGTLLLVRGSGCQLKRTKGNQEAVL